MPLETLIHDEVLSMEIKPPIAFTESRLTSYVNALLSLHALTPIDTITCILDTPGFYDYEIVHKDGRKLLQRFDMSGENEPTLTSNSNGTFFSATEYIRHAEVRNHLFNLIIYHSLEQLTLTFY